MARTLFTLGTLLALGAAQTPTTVSVYFGGDGGPMTASVISANPTVTAYTAHCSQYVDPGCFVGLAEITVANSSIYHITQTEPAKSNAQERLHFINCTVAGSAVCTIALTVPNDGAGVTTSMTIPQESVVLSPVTVTGGLDILSSATITPASASTSAKPNAGSSIKQSSPWILAMTAILGISVTAII